MTRADYMEYLRRFNARDYDGVLAFFAPDAELSFFGVELRSADEVKRFYHFLHAHVSEEIGLERFAASEELVAVEATVRVEGRRDLSREALATAGYPGLHPLVGGQVIEMRQMIHYPLRDGRFAGVRCALV